MEAASNPGTLSTHRIGGGSVIEIHTDQGLSGIGPEIDADALEAAKPRIIGADPFGVEQMTRAAAIVVPGDRCGAQAVSISQ